MLSLFNSDKRAGWNIFQDFSTSCIGLKVCCFSRCVKCYRNNPNLHLPVIQDFNYESGYYRQRSKDAFKYLQARPIYFSITAFQWKLCWFKNSASDRFSLGVIWEDDLDLFWIIEAITGRGVASGLKGLVKCSKLAGKIVPLDYMTPWKVGYDEGMVIAIAMLDK